MDDERALGNGMPRLLGGDLALDFVNTVDPRYGESPRDHLTDYDAWLAWTRYAEVVSDEELRELRATARRSRAEARDAWSTVLRTRDDAHAVFTAMMRRHPVPLDALAHLERLVAAAAGRRHLRCDGRRVQWTPKRPMILDDPLLRVASRIIDLLVAFPADRVRECPGVDGCGWLFIDTTKNRSRRWCSMQVCGNRAKVRQHRKRGSHAQPQARRTDR